MDGERAIWEEGCSATRKQNYMIHDGVALIRITRAWHENRWTYSTVCGGMERGMEECYRGLGHHIITGMMVDYHDGEQKLNK